MSKKIGISGFIAVLAISVFVVTGTSQSQAQRFGPPPDTSQFGSMGELSRHAGYLGISMLEITADQAKQLKLPAVRGVFVADVGPNSPAAKAGVSKDDVITEYNGDIVEGTTQLGRLVHETPPGHTAQVTVWRDGHSQVLTVELGESQSSMGRLMPEMPALRTRMPQFWRPGSSSTPILGITAQDLTRQLGSYFGAPSGEGVLVTGVQKDSPGDKAGLKAGDVITKVDGQAVRNLADLRQQLRDKRDATSITLKMLRKGAETSVTVQLEGTRMLMHEPGSDQHTPM